MFVKLNRWFPRTKHSRTVTTSLSSDNVIKIPAVGLGTSGAPAADLEKAIHVALEAGYRHIDTASLYRNEATIGKALKKWFECGHLRRDQVFITTKLPPTGLHPDRVEKFMQMSLKNLGLDYVDAYLVHFPVGCVCDDKHPYIPLRDERGVIRMEGRTDHAAIWKRMEEQVEAGRTRSIGLSNYNASQVKTVLKCAKIKPSFLQLEMHLYFQQRALLEFCKTNGIVFVAYAPLGSPGYNKKMQQITKNFKATTLPDILHDPKVNQVARKHSKNASQVMLRFLQQLGVAMLPKSVTPQRIVDNFNICDFQLDCEDMATLHSLDKGEEGRIFDWAPLTGFKDHPDYPFGKTDCR